MIERVPLIVPGNDYRPIIDRPFRPDLLCQPSPMFFGQNQTLAGGGSSAPDSGNLAFEWFAHNEGLSNGASVTQLTDSSGHANHATQATSGNRGTYVTGDLGGKASVSFDGSNDTYTFTTAIGSGQAFTLYVVWKLSGSAGGDHTMLGAGNNGPDYQMWSGDRRHRLGGGSNSLQSKSANTWVQSNASQVKVASVTSFAYRADKVAGNSGTVSNTSWTNAAERVGSKFGGDQIWYGWLSAILIYTAGHDTTTKQSVEDYISAFFGGAI